MPGGGADAASTPGTHLIFSLTTTFGLIAADTGNFPHGCDRACFHQPKSKSPRPSIVLRCHAVIRSGAKEPVGGWVCISTNPNTGAGADAMGHPAGRAGSQ